MAKHLKTIPEQFNHMPDWLKATGALLVVAVVACVAIAAASALARGMETPVLPDTTAARFDATISDQNDQSGRRTHPDPLVTAAAARSALDAASATDGVNLFDATTGINQALGPDEAPEVKQAIEAFHEAGYDVGFVVYDLATQRGIGYNVNADFFSASTIKAPFVAYVAQDEIDTGLATRNDEVVEDMTTDGTGIMAFDDEDTYRLEDVLSNTIVHSDNTGYALLRERFDDGGFEDWCAAAGVDAWSWDGEWYPYCSSLDLAKLWLNLSSYVAENKDKTAWLSRFFTQTDSSFLRTALGGRATVLSKPGFEIDTPWFDMGALNDAGMVLTDKGPYVISIMSDADYDSDYFTDNESLIVNLSAALGSAHDTLLARPAEGAHT